MKNEVAHKKVCPHCAGTLVCKNRKNRGKKGWLCRGCGKSFGETFGTLMFGLHLPVEEVGGTPLIVMHRGSLRVAEEITGHKYETIGEWLRISISPYPEDEAKPCRSFARTSTLRAIDTAFSLRAYTHRFYPQQSPLLPREGLA